MFWEEDLDQVSPEVKQRISRAQSVKVDSINIEEKSGVINNHEVSLEKCTCRDYSIQRSPCKHMYRLAHELGLITLSITSPNLERNDAKLFVSQKLTADEKHTLHEILYHHIYDNKLFVCNKSQTISSLVDYGIISPLPYSSDIGINLSKWVLTDYIKEFNCDIKKNMKKSDMLSVLEQNYPDVIATIAAQYQSFIPTKEWEPHARSVYNLLNKEMVSFCELYPKN